MLYCYSSSQFTADQPYLTLWLKTGLLYLIAVSSIWSLGYENNIEIGKYKNNFTDIKVMKDILESWFSPTWGGYGQGADRSHSRSHSLRRRNPVGRASHAPFLLKQNNLKYLIIDGKVMVILLVILLLIVHNKIIQKNSSVRIGAVIEN